MNPAMDVRLAQWARTVEDVERGYPLTFDDYLNDLDLRRTLDEVELSTEQLATLTAIDERFRGASYPAGSCVWGEENAAAEGWLPDVQWYYWRLPVHPGSAFRD
ncbi:MAG TPA: hypothetical protein VGE27_05885 [Gemmatimonas sp.]|uniref:hypothetical protein n=1 Tax=Gemmatimonas sp. TaxID=1962908 RepID=UPI002ED7B9B4